MRVVQLDPAASADQAADLLSAAWPLPHRAYTAAGLRWHLELPAGEARPLTVGAYDGERLCAFAAAIPRRFRLGGHGGPCHVVSFVAVDPAHRGRGVASALYDALLGALAAPGHPVVTFGELGSPGERAILRAYPRAGYDLRALGACPSFAGLPPADGLPAGWAHGAANAGDLDALEANAAGGLVRPWIDDAFVAHAAASTSPVRAVVARDRDGTVRAAATVGVLEMLTTGGAQLVPTVDHVLLSEAAGAPALRTLVAAAADCVPPQPRRIAVNLPNLTGVDPAVAREAGLRQVPARFAAYYCSPPNGGGPPAAVVRGTTFDIL